MIPLGYGLSGETIADQAILLDHPIFKVLQELCRKYDIGIAIGFAEKQIATEPLNNTTYNSAVLIDSTGVVLHYRKSHLFGAEHGVFKESQALSKVVEFRGYQVAIMICMDVEYPETCRSLALQGAQVILSLTAVSHGPCETVLSRCVIPTRALENHVHVLYCNHRGTSASPTCLPFAGNSVIAAPNGKLLAYSELYRLDEELADEFLVADIDREEFNTDILRNPYLQDRRPELYTLD